MNNSSTNNQTNFLVCTFRAFAPTTKKLINNYLKLKNNSIFYYDKKIFYLLQIYYHLQPNHFVHQIKYFYLAKNKEFTINNS